MSELYIESPLQHREAAANLSIGLREIRGRGMIDLRGSTKEPQVHDSGEIRSWR